MKSRTEKRRLQKERNREWVPNPATLDHSVTSYDKQGSYGEPFLFVPGTGGIRRMDKVSNERIRELGGVTKGLMKVFSDGSSMWRGWKMTGLLRGAM